MSPNGNNMLMVMLNVIGMHFVCFACRLMPSALSFSHVIFGMNVTEKKMSGDVAKGIRQGGGWVKHAQNFDPGEWGLNTA